MAKAKKFNHRKFFVISGSTLNEIGYDIFNGAEFSTLENAKELAIASAAADDADNYYVVEVLQVACQKPIDVELREFVG